MAIHIIRHTTPDYDRERTYGQSDIPLASTFEQEYQRQQQYLRDSYDLVITSPLQRCNQLAHKLSTSSLEQDDRIIECNLGDWELKKWKELPKEELANLRDDVVNFRPPNGESVAQMYNRVDEFFTQLIARPEKNIALVTHSGVQRMLHAKILGMPLANVFFLQFGFGAIFEIKTHPFRDNYTIGPLFAGVK